MKRRNLILGLLMVTCLAFTGCKKDEPKVEAEPKPEPALEIEIPEEPEVKEIPANQNLLTGVPDLSEGAIGKRPTAVMVNNTAPALPQYGIDKADIIFEIPVEGNETRFMAMYADYTTLPQICSIRSCRYYFPAISQGFDAFYVNWGIDESMDHYLAALEMDQFDAMYNPGGLFDRDADRRAQGFALEHTGYFNGPAFAGYLESAGVRTDLNEDKKVPAFQFQPLDEVEQPDGDACTSVGINFGAVSAQFAYDAEQDVYKKSHNNNPQVDGISGEQLAFTNVFVLETSISTRDEVDHKAVDWDGGPEAVGYYISNGAVQKISWQKEPDNEKSFMKFYDEQGDELVINRGKSYIAINYPGQATFE